MSKPSSVGRQHPHDGDGDERGTITGARVRERVGADDQLERVEGAGERRVEGGADGAGGAARRPARADRCAAAGTPRPRREARAEPIWAYPASSPTEAPTPFDSMVCATTIRLSVERHPAAIERVGLDRVDRAARPPAGQRQDPPSPISRPPPRQRQRTRASTSMLTCPLSRSCPGQIVEQLVHELRQHAHGGDAQPGDQPRRRRPGRPARFRRRAPARAGSAAACTSQSRKSRRARGFGGASSTRRKGASAARRCWKVRRNRPG